jgi:hypothetical protein
VVYADAYRLSDGVNLLQRAGIELVTIELEKE